MIIGACTHRADRAVNEINAMLDSLKSVYAPDKRVALWELTVSGSKDRIRLEGEVDNKEAYRAIVHHIDQKFPIAENRVVLLPEESEGRLVNGMINNSVANLRAQPGSRSELVTQALLGTPIRILKIENGWGLIQIPNGYLGWTNDSEFHPLDRTELDKFRDAQKIIFSEQYGVSYTDPEVTSMPVSDLVIGCMLPVTAEKSDFYQFGYPDGRLAWVKKDQVIQAGELFDKAITGEGVVEIVRDFNGIPYLWGGASSKALDCSGLTSNVFFMNGTLLPRDADQQSLCGKKITSEYDYHDLVTGDLLFFGQKATGSRPEKITHVAIYLGDGEFIHSAGYHDRVSINSMDSTRENYIQEYPEIFIRATRIIGQTDDDFQPIRENRFYKEIISNTK